MIRVLDIENFKSFDDHSFTLAPLTLFAGLNSMGKSTVLQALLLLRQSWQQQQLTGLSLRGDLVTIGNGSDARCQDTGSDEIAFSLVTADGAEGAWQFRVDPVQDWLPLVSAQFDDNQPIYSESLFGKGFHYLAAERVGPRVSYPVSDYRVRQLGAIGVQGEYAMHYLTEFGYAVEVADRMRHNLTEMESAGDTAKTRFKLWPQVNAWLKEISPGAELKTERLHETDMVQSKWEGYGFRSTNVGFGLSYILPVLVALLSAEPGHLILIENPEAHLHPRGQRVVGELIARCASAGVQVLIETHSDHLLNGIRLAVRQNKILPADVQIYYVDRQPNKLGVPQTVIDTPKLQSDGSLDDWPKGFFDEWEVALRLLLTSGEEEGRNGT